MEKRETKPVACSGHYAGKFFVVSGVEDLEMFGVQSGVGAEGEFTEIAFLHFGDQLFVFGAKALEDTGMNDDAELEVRFVAGAFFEDFAELTLDFDAHRDGTLDLAAP